MSISAAAVSAVCARRFKLVRMLDVSGVSGTGVIAEGVEWSDGTVALHWRGRWPTTTVWDSGGIDAVLAIHGHEGSTQIEWDDGPNGQAFPLRRRPVRQVKS